jgi:hypothetical protein
MIMNKSEERDGAGGAAFFFFTSTDSGQVDVCAASALAADGAAPNWL